MNKVYDIYKKLYNYYGPQGWWPFINCVDENLNKKGVTKGYHILDYSYPKNENDIFEICIGSILAQNTTFAAVVKSLNNLNDQKCLSLNSVKNMDIEQFKLAIKPSGYYNQKTKTIFNLILLIDNLKEKTPTREELLKVKGIGPETADSILLYAYKQPEFTSDTYTKRIFTQLDLVPENAKYDDIKQLVQKALEKEIKDKDQLVIVYQEYHALLVNHAKSFYSKKPYAKECFLNEARAITK